jgi:hypothetical protein
VVDQVEETADIRWALTSDFAIRLAADSSNVTHDARFEEYQDNRKTSGTVTAEYSVSPQTILGANYKEATATFTDAVLNYRDKSTFASASYAISANLGWSERVYETTSHANFSGSTAHASLAWEPSVLTVITLKGWRELGAYLNNESDYYVSNGGALAISWKPMQSTSIIIDGSKAHQDFKGSGIGVLAIVRQDDVTAGNLSMKWNPRRWVEITLADGVEHRNSSNGFFTYSDNIASIKFRLIW